MYIPVNPSFTIYKWGLRGLKLYRHVFVMEVLALKSLPRFEQDEPEDDSLICVTAAKNYHFDWQLHCAF